MEQANQKEATYNAITSAISSNGLRFEDGDDVKSIVIDAVKKEAKAILFDGFRSGYIGHSEKFANTTLENDTALGKYCANLIGNWVRKDKRLNGNVQHVIKNPGIRAGQGDEKVTALRNLKKVVKDPKALAEIEVELQARLEVVKASKVKAVKIDRELLPESLQYLAPTKE